MRMESSKNHGLQFSRAPCPNSRKGEFEAQVRAGAQLWALFTYPMTLALPQRIPAAWDEQLLPPLPLHALGTALLSTRPAPWGDVPVSFCVISVSFCQAGQAEASLGREATLLGSNWEQNQQLFICKILHMCHHCTGQTALVFHPFMEDRSPENCSAVSFPKAAFLLSFSAPVTSLHALPYLKPHCFPSIVIYAELPV